MEAGNEAEIRSEVGFVGGLALLVIIGRGFCGQFGFYACYFRSFACFVWSYWLYVGRGGESCNIDRVFFPFNGSR